MERSNNKAFKQSKGKKGKKAKKKDEVNKKLRDMTLNQAIMLKDIDLKIKKGEFVVIVGEIGSGKSNLLNAILG